MTSYSDTTLPPSPFSSIDDIVISLCDEALKINYNENTSEDYKILMFDLTMEIIDYWEKIRRVEEILCGQKKEI